MAVSSNNNNNINGHVESGWESVKTVFEQNFIDGLDIGAGLCVYYRGKCVINLTGGWQETKTKKEPYTSETLQLVFSVSKGVMAAALARCVENGWLDYQATVAQYWPEFAANDKQVSSAKLDKIRIFYKSSFLEGYHCGRCFIASCRFTVC